MQIFVYKCKIIPFFFPSQVTTFNNLQIDSENKSLKKKCRLNDNNFDQYNFSVLVYCRKKFWKFFIIILYLHLEQNWKNNHLLYWWALKDTSIVHGKMCVISLTFIYNDKEKNQWYILIHFYSILVIFLCEIENLSEIEMNYKIFSDKLKALHNL